MAPQITIIGGGSNQWVPKLLIDFVNTPSLHEAEIVLEDVKDDNLPRMQRFVEHCAEVRGIGMTCRTTTDQRESLHGADFVVVSISTGGFESMRSDLEIPARFGLFQTVGDTVGPGGIMRGLRNIPVMVGIAKDMEELCPDAWLLSLTNPMTTLCRAIARETNVKTVGLCHEVTIISFFVSLMIGKSFLEFDPTITGVNHIPLMTELDCGGDDGLALLHEFVESPWGLDDELPFDLPEGLGMPPRRRTGRWTKGELVDMNRVKLDFFRRFGALPAAGDRHIVEFFPGYLLDEDDITERWNVHLTSIEDRMHYERGFSDRLDEMLAHDQVSHMPSGEPLAGVIDSLLGGWSRNVAVNIPNHGQAPDLPDGVVVESVCSVDRNGIRGRDVTTAPLALGEHLRRISSSQELVVEAALTGNRDLVFQAMLADPLASRIDGTDLEQMTGQLIDATKRWLPAFA
jgi:alpha-galactosidase